LFATGFYDRVHDLKPHQMLRKVLPASAKQHAWKPGNR
jgi:hypothetical protein